MPPFEEEGVYCFANVGRSVGWSVDQMVSTNYLGILVSNHHIGLKFCVENDHGE